MNILQYSDQLEVFAEKWANRCEWEFPDALEHPDVAELGMNIAAIGREDREPDLQEFFEVWLREARFYAFRTNTCTAFCQHYTQMIWDDTEEVGCALHFCNGTTDARKVFVCLYRPPGNFEGQWPYDPAGSMELGSDEVDDGEEEGDDGSQQNDDDDEEDEDGSAGGRKDADDDRNEDDDDDDAENEGGVQDDEEEEEEQGDARRNSGATKATFQTYPLLFWNFIFLAHY
ncbi:hypothetical protein AAHC03_09 [Spirometra sp. Aus1]